MTPDGRFLFLDAASDVTRQDVYEVADKLAMEPLVVSTSRNHPDLAWIQASPTDSYAILEAMPRQVRLSGVVNFSESCQMTAARLANALKINYLSEEVAWRTRDKTLMYECFRDAGLRDRKSVV